MSGSGMVLRPPSCSWHRTVRPWCALTRVARQPNVGQLLRYSACNSCIFHRKQIHQVVVAVMPSDLQLCPGVGDCAPVEPTPREASRSALTLARSTTRTACSSSWTSSRSSRMGRRASTQTRTPCRHRCPCFRCLTGEASQRCIALLSPGW